MLNHKFTKSLPQRGIFLYLQLNNENQIMKKIILLLCFVFISISCKKEMTNEEMIAADTTEITLPEKEIIATEEKHSSSSYTNSDDSANPCIISEDFIKQDLQNPSTADFSIFDCSNEKNSDGTYTVLRKVSAKNSYGVEKEFIYKVTLGFKGGNWVDMSNWDLIKIQSEEYR
jgi:hypothetical protein